MKKYIIGYFTFFASVVLGQTNVSFTYDGAGNMVQRTVSVIFDARLSSSSSSSQNENRTSESDSLINLTVYPNPAQTLINIEGKLPVDCTQADVVILTSDGQVVKKAVYNGENKSINVADLKDGIYFMEVLFNKKQKNTYRIVVLN